MIVELLFRPLVDLLREDVEGRLSDAQLEAILREKGFDDEMIEILWQAKREAFEEETGEAGRLP